MQKFLDLVKEKSNYFALFFCILFVFSTFFTVHGKFWKGLKYEGMALTSDEVSHIPAGYYYLKTKKYFINAEHPPLIKDIAALPLLFLKLKLPEIPEHLKYENIQWDFGGNFLFKVGNDPDLITFCSRTIIIFFNAILLFLVYLFLKKVLGILPSLIFIFLFVFSPNATAHSSLVVFDIPLALFCLLSILTFSIFLKEIENKKFWKNLILASVFTSLALLTKFQAIFLIFSLFLSGLIFILVAKKSFLRKYFLSLVLFSILVLILVGTIHGFQTINMGVEGLQHQIGYSYPSKFPEIGKKILNRLVSFNIFILNGLVEYLVGILMMVSRVTGAWQATYFLGNVYGSEGAGPLYFPILFFTKETIGFLILLFLALYFSISGSLKKNQIQQKINNFFKNPFNVISFVFFLIYGIFSLTMRLNIGVRHIFPIIFLLYAIVAKKTAQLLPKFSIVIILIFLSIIFSWVSTWPYFLSYYNILGGGTWSGYKIATDSNYDWGGQDVKRLAKWVKENKIEKIYGHIFSNVPLNYYLGEAYEYFNIRFRDLPPPGSLIVVSAFELQNVNYDKSLPFEKKYFQLEKNLIARVGTTMFIFEVR